jgi:hypothetical protein
MFLLTLLLLTPAEVKAKVALALAEAPPAATPERLHEPSPAAWRDDTGPDPHLLPAPYPPPHLTRKVAAAARLRAPLVVWVGWEDAALRRALGHHLQVSVAEYEGLRGPGVVVGLPSSGGMVWRRLIPRAEATAAEVFREMAGGWIAAPARRPAEPAAEEDAETWGTDGPRPGEPTAEPERPTTRPTPAGSPRPPVFTPPPSRAPARRRG